MEVPFIRKMTLPLQDRAAQRTISLSNFKQKISRFCMEIQLVINKTWWAVTPETLTGQYRHDQQGMESEC